MLKKLGIVFIVVFLVSSLPIFAGGGKEEQPSSEEEKTTKEEEKGKIDTDVLTIGHYKPMILDPAYLKGTQPDWPIMNCIFNGLVKYKPGTFDVVPDLARRWEVSENNKEITFYLRKGVQFHKDYGELTAEDVQFSFERIIDPDKESTAKNSFATLNRVEVVDDYTVKLIMDEPMARLFTSTLPYYAGLIVSKAAVEEMGKKAFANNPIGTGPYQFESWEGNDITLKRNENYWDTKSEFERVKYVGLQEILALETALKTGELLVGRISKDNLDKLDKREDITTKTFPDLAYWFIPFNCSREPMNNLKLREALRYIIDKEEILIGSFAGVAEPAYSMLPPDLVGHWENAPTYKLEDVGEDYVYDLLEEAGYPRGEGLQLEYLAEATDTERQTATIIQSQLARFGIDMKIKAVEVGALTDGWQAGDYDLTIARYSSTIDPGYATEWFLKSQVGKWNLSHYSTDEYDRLWKEAAVTMDKEKRAELYIEMQKILDANAMTVWLTHGVRTKAWNNGIKPVFSPDGIVLPWLVRTK